VNNEELTEQLNRFRKGEEAAFREIYEELKIPVYTITYRILYDRILSEDVMQEIFLKLSQTPPPTSVKKPRAWIFKMTRNLAIDYKRKIRDNSVLSEELEESGEALEPTIHTRIDLEQAMQRLKENEREIISLRLNAELKFKDIAEILQMPLGTVLWRYQQSIGKLRILLSERVNEE
jgi:RNA polymerase sigma-70 factor (ECF subfamily)